MRPDRNHWPALLGAAVLALAAFAPGAFGQNDTTDPPSGGNETMDTTGASGADSRLSFSGGHAEGRHVSFDLDAATGTICDWTFEGTLVLSEVRWDEFSGEAEQKGSLVVVQDTGEASADPAADEDPSGNGSEDDPFQEADNGTEDNATDEGNATDEDDATEDGNATEDEGNVTTQEEVGACGVGTPDGDNASDAPDDDAPDANGGGTTRVILHDNPVGAIKFEPRGTESLTLTVADGLSVSLDGDRVTVAGDGIEARLFSADREGGADFTVDGQTISFTTDTKANLLWRIVDEEAEGDAAIADAVEDGRVSCEVLVLPDGDDIVEAGDDEVVQVTTTRSASTIDITIDVDIEVDVDVNVTEDVEQPEEPANETDDANGTDDGDDGNGTSTDDGDDTDAGDDADVDTNTSTPSPPPVTVIVIDLDATVVADVDISGLVLTMDGEQVRTAASVDEVLEAEGEAAAVAVATADGGIRVVTTAAEGSQVLSLQSGSGSFDAESVPLFGDGSDELEGTAVDGSDADSVEDDEGSTDITVPAPTFVLTALALLAVAALALRRRS
jgi:hypothetical protein